MRRRSGLAWAALLCLRASSAEAGHPTKSECISANETGQDLRRAGKLRDATAKYEFCSASACPASVRDDCVNRLAEARRAIPTIIFVAKDAKGAALSDVKVTMDGAPLLERIDGTAVAVEPGEHTFAFVSQGFARVAKKIVVVESVKGREEVIALESSAFSSHGDENGVLQHRTLAYVAGGAGVLLLVVGGVMGLLAKSRYDDAVASCDAPVNGTRRCEGAGLTAGDSANTLATVSTVAFITGGALVATSVVLFALAPPPRRSLTSTLVPHRLAVNIGGASVQLAGSW